MDSTRRYLVNKVYLYMKQNFGNYPRKDQKIAVAKAVVALFPTYKTNNKDGIVSIKIFKELYI